MLDRLLDVFNVLAIAVGSLSIFVWFVGIGALYANLSRWASLSDYTPGIVVWTGLTWGAAAFCAAWLYVTGFFG